MRVVVGIDLRTDGHAWLVQRACDWAARASGSPHQVDLVHFTPDGDLDALSRRLADNLDQIPPRLRGHALVQPGDPAEGLVQLTREADLLVVGSREPAALERWLHGPMAARVLRQASCPVLVPRGQEPPTNPARLLVGVDITDLRVASIVMQLAAAWARQLSGTVDAVYAVAQRLPHIPERSVRERAEREWELLHEDERRSLEQLMTEHIPADHRGRALVRRGEADDVLIAESARRDLVLVGNRDREGLARLVLGTVAQRVVRNASSDVLSLPTAHLA